MEKFSTRIDHLERCCWNVASWDDRFRCVRLTVSGWKFSHWSRSRMEWSEIGRALVFCHSEWEEKSSTPWEWIARLPVHWPTLKKYTAFRSNLVNFPSSLRPSISPMGAVRLNRTIVVPNLNVMPPIFEWTPNKSTIYLRFGCNPWTICLFRCPVHAMPVPTRESAKWDDDAICAKFKVRDDSTYRCERHGLMFSFASKSNVPPVLVRRWCQQHRTAISGSFWYWSQYNISSRGCPICCAQSIENIPNFILTNNWRHSLFLPLQPIDVTHLFSHCNITCRFCKRFSYRMREACT